MVRFYLCRLPGCFRGWVSSLLCAYTNPKSVPVSVHSILEGFWPFFKTQVCDGLWDGLKPLISGDDTKKSGFLSIRKSYYISLLTILNRYVCPSYNRFPLYYRIFVNVIVSKLYNTICYNMLLFLTEHYNSVYLGNYICYLIAFLNCFNFENKYNLLQNKCWSKI